LFDKRKYLGEERKGMRYGQVKLVLTLLIFSVIVLSLLYINAKEQQINAENKVSKLEQRVDNLQQEKVSLVDEVFNLNSQLEKK
jgi:cell division protein FtsB